MTHGVIMVMMEIFIAAQEVVYHMDHCLQLVIPLDVALTLQIIQYSILKMG